MNSYTVTFYCSGIDDSVDVSIEAESAEEAQEKVQALADGECNVRGHHKVTAVKREEEA